MPRNDAAKPQAILVTLCAFALAGCLTATAAWAGTLTTLYRFTGGSDGSIPTAGVVQDAAGVLYGATNNAGAAQCAPKPGRSGPGCGTVFSFSASAGLKTLITFTGPNGAHGANTLLLNGNTLYGNTLDGGTGGDGVLFSIHTDGTGFTLLHQFNGTDGRNPSGTVQAGPGGVLYGITAGGGPNNRGVVFQLAPDGTYTILHAFTGGADGADPTDLLRGKSGLLVGSAFTGGVKNINCPSGCGVIFTYNPPTALFTAVHSFNGMTDGGLPFLGSLGPGEAANGVAATLFILSQANGFLNIPFNVDSGFSPLSGPALARDGSLIGVNSDGPNEFGAAGTLYQGKNGAVTDLYLFGGLSDGSGPVGEPLITATGIFGTTEEGGTTGCIVGCGTLYQYTP